LPTVPYYAADGRTRLPSVTTVLSTGLGGYSKDALIHWAWKLGMEGVDYREKRDKAANAGTVAHAMIENYLNGKPISKGIEIDDDTILEPASVAFKAFRSWHREHDIHVVKQETSLTDHEHGFGGTFDALLDLNGVLTLADWKTSSDIYGSYVAQVGAYHQLIKANLPARFHPTQAVIVKVSKDGDLRVVELDTDAIALGWDVFQAALRVYTARKPLDALVAKPSAARTAIQLPTATRKATA
jgi:hypothetical protein